jgi:hypothetical protein
MLRGLLLALLGANLLFLAWSQGWMAPAWPGPRTGQSEPQRLANQLRPEWVQVLPASAAASRVAGARREARACLEAGPLPEASLAAAEASLAAAAVPAGSWVRVSNEPGASWLRADNASAELQARLKALPADELAGGFRPCRTP